MDSRRAKGGLIGLVCFFNRIISKLRCFVVWAGIVSFARISGIVFRCQNVKALRTERKRLLEEEKLAREDGELVIIYGGLGVGKTTYLCQIGKYYDSQGRSVYTNIPDTPFNRLPDSYWEYRYPRGSCILIDEIGIIHDNRQYASLPVGVRDWYKYVRHHGLHVFACSQTADVDKKVRVLATEQELIKKEKYLFFLTRIRRYSIIPEIGYIDEITNRFIAEDYYSVVGKKNLRLKKFYKFHNSHSELPLPMYELGIEKQKGG